MPQHVNNPALLTDRITSDGSGPVSPSQDIYQYAAARSTDYEIKQNVGGIDCLVQKASTTLPPAALTYSPVALGGQPYSQPWQVVGGTIPIRK